ncbi:6916_t:CDS:1, partial [Gigaspora margarita]
EPWSRKGPWGPIEITKLSDSTDEKEFLEFSERLKFSEDLKGLLVPIIRNFLGRSRELLEERVYDDRN